MKTSTKFLGIALVVLVVASGLAAAAGGYGIGPTATDRDQTPTRGGSGPVTTADRPYDGHNSPWVTGDERLEQFQERFGLTDAQMAQLRADVTAMIQDGTDHDAIQAQIRTTLENYGVDDPALGPMDGPRLGDGPRGTGTGPHGPGAGVGPADGTARHGGHGGFGAGGGPYGPADGSCMN
jgi:Spy/CpxP family protein refolding chaperone